MFINVNGKNQEILLMNLHGSHLYGLANENSDKDYKGIYLPSFEDVILNRYPKTIDIEDREGDLKNQLTETQLFSLPYFIKMALEGQTVAFDLLFSPKSAVIFTDERLNFLFENKDKLINKTLKPILGYAYSQAIRYVTKSNILNFLNRMKLVLQKVKEEDMLSDHIEMLKELYETPDLLKIEVLEEKDKNDKEIYKVTIDKTAEFYSNKAHIKNLLESVNSRYEKYGVRSKECIKTDNIDYKSLSHAMRCISVARELCVNRTFTYPLPDSDFIRSVKERTFKGTNEDVVNFIYDELKRVEEMLDKSDLPEKTDPKLFDDYLINLYRKTPLYPIL